MPRYRADPPATRLVVAAEEMTLLYHRPSGTTHVLLTPAPEILAALEAGPADAATLVDRLGLTEEPEAEAVVTARLEELAAAGLVAAGA